MVHGCRFARYSVTVLSTDCRLIGPIVYGGDSRTRTCTGVTPCHISTVVVYQLTYVAVEEGAGLEPDPSQGQLLSRQR